MLSEDEENFENWLFAMDEALENFFMELPVDLRSRLNFSPVSLDALEEWVLEKYPGTATMLRESEKKMVDGLARYIGETYRKVLGKVWEIRFDDPKQAYYGIPQLSDSNQSSTPICPHALATATADRRTGNFLSTVLKNSKRYK
jgi:hypothetical protein